MTQKINGLDTGNRVKEVRVSEGTRSMASGRRDHLESDIRLLAQERQQWINRINQIAVELNSLDVRVVGRRLPQQEYNDICRRQVELKRELVELQAKTGATREQLAAMRNELEQPWSERLNRMEKKIDLILQMLQQSPGSP